MTIQYFSIKSLNDFIDKKIQEAKNNTPGYPLYSYCTSGFPMTLFGYYNLGQVHALECIRSFIESDKEIQYTQTSS